MKTNTAYSPKADVQGVRENVKELSKGLTKLNNLLKTDDLEEVYDFAKKLSKQSMGVTYDLLAIIALIKGEDVGGALQAFSKRFLEEAKDFKLTVRGGLKDGLSQFKKFTDKY